MALGSSAIDQMKPVDRWAERWCCGTVTFPRDLGNKDMADRQPLAIMYICWAE
jgi:hypothetical protein